MNRSLVRSGSSRFARFSLVAAAIAGLVAADQILQAYSATLTTYLAAKTLVQGVKPRPEQRGVNLDGSLRKGSTHPIALAGNPFESAWRGSAELNNVRLDTGTWSPTQIDISLPAIVPWVIGRSYNARQDDSGLFNSDGMNGANWFQCSAPEIKLYVDAGNHANDVLYCAYRADAYVEFQRISSGSDTYKSRNGAAGVFVRSGSGPEIWTWTDQVGTEITFLGFDTTSHHYDGQLWKVKFPDAGKEAFVGSTSSASAAISANGWDSAGRILVAYDSSSRRFTYAYQTLDSVVRLTQVKAESKDLGSSWSSPTGLKTLATVDYDYYTNEQNGDPGDLKYVTLTTPMSDSGVNLTQRSYFRYYEGTYNSSTNPGYSHAVKLMLDDEGARRYDWLDTTFDDDYASTSVTDATLKPYAAAYFEYDTSHRINLAFFNGQCGCGGGGASNGEHTYLYESNGSFSGSSGYDTTWYRRTVVGRPDGSYITQYFDEVGQPLSLVTSDGDPASGSPPTSWVNKVIRDSSGCVTETWTPDSISAYTHSTGSFTDDLTPSAGNSGLMHKYTRVPSGDATGFLSEKRWHDTLDAETSSYDFYEGCWTWDVTSATETVGGVGVVRPLIASSREYWDKVISSSSGSNLTSYGYSTHSGQGLAVEKVTQTVPTISTGANGSNTAHYIYAQYQSDGRLQYKSEQESSGGVKIVQRVTYTADGLIDTQYEDATVTSGMTSDTDFQSQADAVNDNSVRTYDDEARLLTKSTRDGRLPRMYRTVLGDRRIIELDFTNWEDLATDNWYGPTSFRVKNQAGKIEAEAMIGFSGDVTTETLDKSIDESDTDPLLAVGNGVAYGYVVRYHTFIYDESGTQLNEERAYFLIPGSGAGADGTNYDPTFYKYDSMGRRVRTKEPTGTITRTEFDARGNAIERWIGTNDADEAGTDNIVKVEATTFDTNSYVTARTAYIQDSTTGQRVTSYTNDAFGRPVIIGNPLAPHALNAYDNLGRVTGSAQFSSTSGLTVTSNPLTSGTMSNRLAASATKYDERGRVYQTVRYKIDASDGSDDDTLTTDSWYSEDGKLWKRDGEQLQKFAYDRLGRQTHQFILASVDSTEASTPTAANAADVAGDVVLEERQTSYDTLGRVIMEATISRFHDDLATGNTGALDTNADADALKYTSGNVKGRIQISSMWHDSLGRLVDRVEYGTYGGSTFDRNGLSAPARSDTALRTTNSYAKDGMLASVIDPRNLTTMYYYDDLGRRTKVTANYVNGSPSANGDDDQTVIYAYTDGLQTSITADLAGTDQVTTYTFGTTKGTNPGDSKIATGHLLSKVQYPDSASSTWDIVAFAYNAQSQETWKRDQATDSGHQSDYNIIETTYDDSGRQTSRAVTQLRAACDNAVLRIETAYDSLGRTSTVTQYDAASSGSVVDQVKYVYDGWSDVTSFQQDRDSVVGTGTHYDVSYAYAKATSGRNTLRRTSETLPNGDVYNYAYSSSGNLLDDVASRVTQIQNGSNTPLVTYDYNGTGQVVKTYLEEPDAMWKLEGSSSGVFDDLDRFNRVTTSKWTKDLSTDRDFYHVNLTYDRNSNITSADDTVHTGFDVLYTNDSLNRLTEAQEGTLTAGSISPQFRDEQWTLSQTGNWDRNKLNLNGDGDFTDTGELDDTRVHNDVNELSTRDTDSVGGVNYTLAYDAAGNMTDDGKDYKFEWDAFGRLRRVKNQSNNLVSEYWYNGLGYRLSHKYDTDRDGDCDSNDKKFHYVYDDRWRIVAMYRGTDANPKQQFLYHCAGNGGYGGSSYIDLCVFRDRDAGSGESAQADSSLEERVYYCQNWRADVVALIDTAGLWEWAKYSAYGVPFGLPGGDTDSDGDCDAADITQLDTWIASGPYDVRGDIDLNGTVDAADKTAITGGYQGLTAGRGVLTNILNRKGYAGYEGDATSASKWHVRNRALASELGRWLQHSSGGYENGANLCSYTSDFPFRLTDPLDQPHSSIVVKSIGSQFISDGRYTRRIPAKGMLGETGEADDDVLACGRSTSGWTTFFPPGAPGGRTSGGTSGLGTSADDATNAAKYNALPMHCDYGCPCNHGWCRCAFEFKIRWAHGAGPTSTCTKTGNLVDCSLDWHLGNGYEYQLDCKSCP
jgi:hypothetical protein